CSWHPSEELEPLASVVRGAELCLEKLKARSAKNPNAWTVSSTRKPYLCSLLEELMHLWQVATGTIKPQAEKDSNLIKFLCKGAWVIAQRNVDLNTAIRLARELVPRAYKRLDLGYLPFRGVDDPVFLQYLEEHGPDC